MQEGGRIHRMIQRRMGADYHAEVSLRWIQEYDGYELVVEGRADGIIDTDPVTVDEIKGTYRDLERMKGAGAGPSGAGKVLCVDIRTSA